MKEALSIETERTDDIAGRHRLGGRGSSCAGRTASADRGTLCGQSQTPHGSAHHRAVAGSLQRDHLDHLSGLGFVQRHLPPLSALQQQILALCGFSPAVYTRLTDDS